MGGLKIEFLLNTHFQLIVRLLTGSNRYKKKSILLLRKQEGEHLKWDVNQRNNQRMTELERLQAENEYLRAENAILKSWENSVEGGKEKEEKTQIVRGLVHEFRLDILLKIIKLARSTYYYHLKQLNQEDKNQTVKTK